MTLTKLQPRVDIRRSGQRFHTQTDWLDSRHSFSFSYHYDPLNLQHGLLLVHNDDIVKPNTGFRTHPHRDMEIVTWVLGRTAPARRHNVGARCPVRSRSLDLGNRHCS